MLLSAVLLCSGHSSLAVAPQPIQGLFPASGKVAGWVLQSPPRVYPDERVFDYMDGAGEIPRGYGLREVASAKYQKGKTTLEVAVFELGRPADAFGYFSVRSFLEHSSRSRDRTIAVGRMGRLNEAVGTLTFWKGRYAAIVQPDIGRPEDSAILAFGRAVASRIRENGNYPELVSRLRRAGIVPGSERYVRGKAAFDAALLFTPKDVFGMAKGAEAAGAEYALGAATPTLILLRYPNAGGARAAYVSFRQYLLSRKAKPTAGGLPDSYVAVDPRQKCTGARLTGSLLGVVTGAKDAASARAALHLL